VSLNDNRLTCFLINGITKEAMPEMELAWLQDNGATSDNRMDAWEEVLTLQGFPYSTYPDARNSWLKNRGYSGSTQDMLNLFWLECESIEGTEWIGSEAWIDGEAWND